MTIQRNSAGTRREQVSLQRFQLIDLRLAAVQIERLAIAAKRVVRTAGKSEADDALCIMATGAVVEAIHGEVRSLLDLLNDLSPESDE